MRQKWWTIAFLALVGCGEREAFIAEKVEMNVHFSSKLVAVTFHLAQALQIPSSARVEFRNRDDQLSLLFVRSTDGAPTRLGTVFSAAQMGSDQWPVDDFNRMPNLERLPQSVPTGGLKRWKLEQNDVTFLSLYQHEPRLITGGAIVSREFDFLSIGFFATQYFRDEFGNPTGSISLVGPTLLEPGGIYFLGNFDLNPFFVFGSAETKSIELKATEPAQVLNWGRGKIDFESLPTRLNKLSRSLQ